MASTPVSKRKLALAIDIGGTHIKAGIITRAGRALASRVEETPARCEPEVLINHILRLIHSLAAESQTDLSRIDGIGISMAAFITADGVVTATAHLSQAWVGYNLHARLFANLPAEYYFSLDTPAPTLGEAYYGAGRGISELAYVTVSTGIGAGILVNGKYFTGGLGWAGGVGHIIIDENSPRRCEGCGNYGCLETFASKQGIITTARELVEAHPSSMILTIARSRPESITPRTVYEAAEAGDAHAIEVFRRAGHALGLGLVSLADIVAPNRIVVGGGIASAGEFLLGPARAVVQARAYPPRIRSVEIVQAELGDQSGIFGAAAMVFHDLRINSPIEAA
jgi:glucokinase